jgi:hypothetical protein
MKIFEVYEAGKTERSGVRGRNASALLISLSIKYAPSLLKPRVYLLKFTVLKSAASAVGGGGKRVSARVFLHVIMHRRQLKRKARRTRRFFAAFNETTAFILQSKCSFACNFCPRHAPLRHVHTHICTHGGSSEMPRVRPRKGFVFG